MHNPSAIGGEPADMIMVSNPVAAGLGVADDSELPNLTEHVPVDQNAGEATVVTKDDDDATAQE